MNLQRRYLRICSCARTICTFFPLPIYAYGTINIIPSSRNCNILLSMVLRFVPHPADYPAVHTLILALPNTIGVAIVRGTHRIQNYKATIRESSFGRGKGNMQCTSQQQQEKPCGRSNWYLNHAPGGYNIFAHFRNVYDFNVHKINDFAYSAAERYKKQITKWMKQKSFERIQKI